MNELNTGADWEQSKRLVIHWHNLWSKLLSENKKLEKENDDLKSYLIMFLGKAKFNQLMSLEPSLEEKK
jgi:hypothetical protein